MMPQLIQLIGLAANPTGAGFKDYVLAVAGNILVIVIVVRAVGHYMKKEWGDLVGHIVGGIIVGGLVWANDQSIAILKSFWSTLIGS